MNPTRTITRILTSALATTALASVMPASAGATTPCPQSFGSFGPGHWPAACWRPYGPDSPFNKEIPAGAPSASDSGAIINHMKHNGWHFEGGSQFAFISPGRGAVYYSQPSDPMVKIQCTYKWGQGTCQGDDHVSLDGKSIRVPSAAQPQDGSDQHMTIVDQAAGMEYDFEHAEWSADHSTLIVWAGGELPIGANSGTGLGVPSTAASFSTIAGLIREQELAAGSINHALVISIPCTQGKVWPSAGPWGFDCSQLNQSPGAGEVAPHMGTLFQLNLTDEQIAATGAPTWERAIMVAMSHYGMYVNDTNGSGDPNSITIEKESDLTFTTMGGQPEMANLIKSLGGSYWAPSSRWILSGLPISLSNLRVVDPCVAQGTCPDKSGGALPSAVSGTASSATSAASGVVNQASSTVRRVTATQASSHRPSPARPSAARPSSARPLASARYRRVVRRAASVRSCLTHRPRRTHGRHLRVGRLSCGLRHAHVVHAR